jgi:hypothetical protein
MSARQDVTVGPATVGSDVRAWPCFDMLQLVADFELFLLSISSTHVSRTVF